MTNAQNPEPDTFGGPDPGVREDELAGAATTEPGPDTFGGPDPGSEDELAGPDATGPGTLGGPDVGPEDELGGER